MRGNIEAPRSQASPLRQSHPQPVIIEHLTDRSRWSFRLPLIQNGLLIVSHDLCVPAILRSNYRYPNGDGFQDTTAQWLVFTA